MAVLISISANDPRPIYLQIVTEVKEQIHRGNLHPGDELPSVRDLAENLGVNLHTVHRAYEKLRDQGVISLRLGQRAKVAALRQQPASREQVEEVLVTRLNELITEAFHLGLSASAFRQLVDELLAEKYGGSHQ